MAIIKAKARQTTAVSAESEGNDVYLRALRDGTLLTAAWKQSYIMKGYGYQALVGGFSTPLTGGGNGEGSGSGKGSGSSGGTGGSGGDRPETGAKKYPDKGENSKPDTSGKSVKDDGRIESIGRALRKAQKQIDTDNIDPKLLKKLNMNKQQFIKFIEKYNERFDNKKNLDDADRKTTKNKNLEMVGKTEMQKGKTNGVDNVKLNGESGEKNDSGAKQTSVRKVSPKHRNKLDAYFRAISEGEKNSKSNKSKSSDSEK